MSEDMQNPSSFLAVSLKIDCDLAGVFENTCGGHLLGANYQNKCSKMKTEKEKFS